jgi:hypothetical protein
MDLGGFFGKFAFKGGQDKGSLPVEPPLASPALSPNKRAKLSAPTPAPTPALTPVHRDGIVLLEHDEIVAEDRRMVSQNHILTQNCRAKLSKRTSCDDLLQVIARRIMEHRLRTTGEQGAKSGKQATIEAFHTYLGELQGRPDGAFLVLCAALLSVQCRDGVALQAAAKLFAAFPTLESMAEAEEETILGCISVR